MYSDDTLFVKGMGDPVLKWIMMIHNLKLNGWSNFKMDSVGRLIKMIQF